ncbi:MAG TPA: response regulator transcription factor [Thermoanaerobaculia bacterium]|nr:response regulator transcription factor [Thermoanaerobaculia bacterium]
MIRVCVVDDQTLVRHGIRTLLGLVPGIEVVAEADGGRAALSLIPEHRPDVVLLDLRMPDLDGLGVLRELKAAGGLPPTLVLTTFEDDALFLETIRAGAKGFLLKDVSLERLAEAIRTVAGGGTLIQPAVTERILRCALEAGYEFPSLDPPDPLTEREVEVLRLMTGGYNNREIADALRVAEGTVKNHISSILSKLGVRDRTRAVLKGLEMGLL